MGEQFELELGEKLKAVQRREGYSDVALERLTGLSKNTLNAVFSTSEKTLHGNYVKVAKALDKKIIQDLEDL